MLLTLLLLTLAGEWSASTGLVPDIQAGDGKSYYMPGRAFSARILQSGHLPAWDPYIYGGYPHIADVQTAFFYPPNLILFLIFRPNVAFVLAIAFNILLIAFFTSRFLSLFVRSRHAVWLGSATFALAGILSNNAVTLTIPDSAAWVPAIFWCIEKWIRTGSWRYCIWGGVCLAVELLAGWPQMVLLTVLYATIYILFSLRRQIHAGKLFGGFILMGLLSAGIGMAQLLPTLELKSQTILQKLSYPEFVFGSIAPQLIILLFFPFLLGAGIGDLHTLHKVAYYGPISHQVSVYYIGILPVMLAIATIALWRRSHYVRYGLVAAGTALPLMWAGYTPLGRLLYHLPVYNFFHDHRIHLVFFDFSVALLAACAADAMEAGEFGPRGRKVWSWAVPVGTIGFAALLLVHARGLLQSINPNAGPLADGWLVSLHKIMRIRNPDMMVPVVLMIVAGALFYFWMRRPGSKAVAILAVILVIADLGYYGVSGEWNASPTGPSPDEAAALAAMKQIAGTDEFHSLSPRKWFYPALSPNLNILSRHPDILGLGPFLPRYHAALLTSTTTAEVTDLRGLLVNNTVLSALNVRFLELEKADFEELQRAVGVLPPEAVSNSNPQTPQAVGAPAANLLAGHPWSSGEIVGEETSPITIRSSDGNKFAIAQTRVRLEPDAFYELDAKLRFVDPHDAQDCGAGLQAEDWARYFSVYNWMLSSSRAFEPYASLYATGSKAEMADIKFVTRSTSGVELKDISLRKISSPPFDRTPYRLAGRFGGLYLVENTAANHRVFFASSVRRVASFTAARAVLWGTADRFDAQHDAVVEAAADQLPADISVGTIEHLSYQPNRIDLQVSCPSNCYLAVADVDYPGWRATVDGRRTTIHRTNAMMQGTVVPQGRHHVQFAFVPRSLHLGMLVSFATLLAAILFLRRSAVPGN